MPRLNLPQKQVGSAGSTGVQPDIDISSPQFAAIERLSMASQGLANQRFNQSESVAAQGFKQSESVAAQSFTISEAKKKALFEASVQLQKHVDEGQASAAARDNINWTDNLNMELSAVPGDKAAQDRILAVAIKERRTALVAEMTKKGVSAAQMRSGLEEFGHLEDRISVKLKTGQIKEVIDSANVDKTANITRLLKNGQTEEADAIAESLQLTDAEKKKNLQSAKDRVSSEAYTIFSNRVNQAPTIEDLNLVLADSKGTYISEKDSERLETAALRKSESIEKSDLAAVTKEHYDSSDLRRIEAMGRAQDEELLENLDVLDEELDKSDMLAKHKKEATTAVNSRRKVLERSASRSVHNAISSGLNSSFIDPTALQDPNIDPVTRAAIDEFNQQNNTGIGPNSDEFREDFVNARTAQGIISSIQGDPDELKRSGRKARKDAIEDFPSTQKSIDRMLEIATSPDFNGVARSQALEMYASLRFLDSQDGYWQGTTKINEQLSPGSIQAYSMAQDLVSSLTRGEDGRIVSLRDMGMDPRQISDLYVAFDKLVANGTFQDLTPDEAIAMFDEKVTPIKNKLVEKSAILTLSLHLTQ